MKGGELKVCRKCGRRIGVIEWKAFRRVLVDPAAVMVVADPEGEEFIRIGGTKVLAREAEYESEEQAEPAYRPHHRTCGVRK